MTAPEAPATYESDGTLEATVFGFYPTPYDHDMYDPKCSMYDIYSNFHTLWEMPCLHQHFCYHCAKNSLGGYA